MSTAASETAFGIEEEFMFLSSDLLRPMAAAEAARLELLRDPAVARYVGAEFLASQLEHSSPVLASRQQAFEALNGFRERLGRIAESMGVLAAGTGAPFDTDGWPAPTPGRRYERIRESVRAVADDHQLNALHVHVNVPSRDAGVHALNGVRPWIPVLLALGSNSPFWHGRDTGFASWRALLARRWATSGCPPHFRDAADYDARAARIVDVGASVDLACIAWDARLSERFPTLELRVFDAQLDAESSVLLAILARALVVTSLTAAPLPPAPSELLAAQLWLAARDGLHGRLVNPVSGELDAAAEVVRALLEHVQPALQAHGDGGFVEAALAQRLREGTGAEHQRAAFRAGGAVKLSALLHHSLVQAPLPTP
ncbi:carboxylate-amine ligase [Microterricola viridarii]|uniref:Putative glutamate--cysteine ligase 2 n=1 Tax=Microterricola viridarii TaxID=412690 RepID=A0A1H1MA03_9MICO|nr:YbdK family carboxylate-amine ligase [Microterricola viridarii]SDR83598.1 carboxylate-amine ligase [Microterricola viridarii]